MQSQRLSAQTVQRIAVAALTLGLLAAPAVADEYRTFYVDPIRSSLHFVSGQAFFDLATGVFGSGELSAQTGTVSTAALSGHFNALALGSFTSPTYVGILQGSSDFQVANDNLIAPAVEGADGVAPGAFGLSFLDGVFLLGADIALRDLRLSAEGSVTIQPNPLGPLGLVGELAWQIASGIADVRADVGLAGRAYLSAANIRPLGRRFTGSVVYQSSQLTEISPGEYELLLPFGFSGSSSQVPGPIANLNLSGGFEGQIVATTVPIPEPAEAWTMLVSLLSLATLRASKRPR